MSWRESKTLKALRLAHADLLLIRNARFAGLSKREAAGLRGDFTVNADDYEDFREALGKLTLNDASLFYEPEDALGFGSVQLSRYAPMIIQERLEREYDLDLIATPSDLRDRQKKSGDDLRGQSLQAA